MPPPNWSFVMATRAEILARSSVEGLIRALRMTCNINRCNDLGISSVHGTTVGIPIALERHGRAANRVVSPRGRHSTVVPDHGA
jgi:hypothetical protein